MRNRILVSLLPILIVIIVVWPTPVNAQEGTAVLLGGTVVVGSSSGGFGGSAIFEIPLGGTIWSSLTLLAGAASAPTNHRVVFGGGLKYTRPVNEKFRFFVEVLSGLLLRYGDGATRREFGITPAAGFLYAIRDRMDFFLMVGPGVIEKSFETRVGAQITAGIVIPLKR
jgi:hypothetical protein